MSTLINPCRAAALTLFMLGGIASAQAAAATTTANVNVRSGAGTQFRVIATLAAGTRIDIDNCRAGWCELTTRGRQGFVSQSLLQTTPTRPEQPPRTTKPRDNRQPQAPSQSQPQPQPQVQMPVRR